MKTLCLTLAVFLMPPLSVFAETDSSVEELITEEFSEDKKDWQNNPDSLDEKSPLAEAKARGFDGKKQLRQADADLVENDDFEEITDVELFIPKMVDILFVVDNTHSMRYILRSIYNKMIGFTFPLQPYDWRAGFISADVKNRKVKQELMPLEYNGRKLIDRKYITKDTENSNQILLDTLTRAPGDGCALAPYCGSRRERPLGALSKFLRSSGKEEGFLREGASLAVVILTDNRENKYNGQTASFAEVFDSLEQYYPGKNLKVYGLTVKDRSCQLEIRKSNGPVYEGNFADSIEQFSEQSGGSFSLCASSYTHVAEKIAEDHGAL